MHLLEGEGRANWDLFTGIGGATIKLDACQEPFRTKERNEIPHGCVVSSGDPAHQPWCVCVCVCVCVCIYCNSTYGALLLFSTEFLHALLAVLPI